MLLVAVPLYPLLLMLIRPHYRGTGLGWILSLLLIPVLVLEHKLRRMNAREHGKDTPYTPAQRLTR